jgi:predicted ATPase
LQFIANLHQFRREERSTQERAEAAMALSAEQGFAQAHAQAALLRGWAVAEQGQEKDGIVQMQWGLAAYRETGAKLTRPYYLALLARGYGKVGQAEDGLSALAEALALVDKTGERYYEAELYRLKGELTLTQSSSQKEAEECFWKAIEIARQQQAKSWELRASTSLACLWQQQGKKNEAHHLLAEIYGWFTEGFDTKDLQEAKALLESLT